MLQGLQVYLHAKSGQFHPSKALRLPPQCRPLLNSPASQPNKLTLENTENKHEVSLQIPSRIPTPKSDDMNSEKKERKHSDQKIRVNETERQWGNPRGQQGVTVMTQQKTGGVCLDTPFF